MKKVISALTAAAMCASMSASAITVFAEYTAANTSFYLKVVDATAGTISEDGTKITFASAAEAKDAKLTVQEFIKADAANPSVQQVGSTFSVSDKAIKLSDGVSYSKKIGDDKEYTVGDKTFTTNLFVNCFGYLNSRGKYQSGTGDASWGHSDQYTWDYSGVDQLSIIWASDFGDDSRDNYKETAAFLADTSDAVPFTQFNATIGDVADGTYTIDIIDKWEHAENGTQNGTFINTDGKTKLLITEHPGITIEIGDASASDPGDTPADPGDTPADPGDTPADPGDTPADPGDTPADPGDTPADPGTSTDTPSQSLDDKKNAKEWTWYLDDVYLDIEAGQKEAEIHVFVTKDPGTYGYNFTLLIDGKTVDEAGWKFDVEPTDVYEFETFQPNKEKGKLGAASKLADENNNAINSVAEDGDKILDVYLTPPSTVKVGEKYIVTLDDLVVGDANDKKSNPAVIAGSITIGKKGTTPTTPDPGTDDPGTDDPGTTPDPGTDPGTDDPGTTPDPGTDDPGTVDPGTPSDVKYLYGDVNEDGKVELVDVVKLNRFLTKLDTKLSDVATVNANCMRDKGESDADTTTADLNGKDSVEILRTLIGLVAQADLPTKA